MDTKLEMRDEGALVMPSNCVAMKEAEMAHVEGGKTFGYQWSYASVGGAAAGAIKIIAQQGWNKSLVYALSAEIYSHAMAYYSTPNTFFRLVSMAGYNKTAIQNSSWYRSINNGIDLVNGRDTATICGVPRWCLFDAIYGCALAM